jgi:hypothetical protein
MERIPTDNLFDFSFPDMDLSIIEIQEEAVQEVVEIKKLEPVNVDPMLDSNIANKIIETLNSITKKEDELNLIKLEYEKKLELLNQVTQKLENPLAIINEQMIETVHFIIKKCVRCLIYKEIKSDPKLINRISKEVSELITAEDGMISIQISEADYSRLSDSIDNSKWIYKVNPDLSEGDVIVQTKYAEVRAILNTRLNQMIGTKYE